MNTRKAPPSTAPKVPTVAELPVTRAILEVVQGYDARFERLEASVDEVRGMVRELLDIAKQRPRT